ncbi:MAG: nucleotidyltransferase, partial [Defluviitaleaceae bacterium]|nr:nucleotidyltransferase [Defluviitaleaceae bacterium]
IGYTDPKTGYHPLPDDSIVNMLAFAFTPKVFDEIEKGFGKFYETYVKDNIDAEYFLTLIVKSLILEMVATMKVLPVDPKDRWIGVTYKPDVEIAKESIAKLINAGEYPQKLF